MLAFISEMGNPFVLAKMYCKLTFHLIPTRRGDLRMSEGQKAEYDFSKRQITLGLVAIFAVYGTMAYFVQTLTNARPKIAANLNGMDLYAWAVTIPSLISAFVTLVFGKLSDIYGRRILLLISVICCLIGTILGAFSPNFKFLIVAGVISALGTGAMMPLVFAVVGDLFPPEKRGKWIGLLNIPTGFFSLIGPTLGGWFVDNLGWRYLYWISLPLLVVCLITVPIGVPSLVSSGVKRKIDVLGCILVGIASSTLIIAFSFAGSRYPWGSPQNIGLLAISLVFWILFFYTENRVDEPILDPKVLRNRSFFTVATATLLSFFGQMGMMMYFPMFLQGVQGISTTKSGSIITPNAVIMSFVGIPVGFILARSKKFKWMYVLSFGILTLDMFAVTFFTEQTPLWCCVAAASIAGLGLGAIPTLNTMVVQNAVPKRLLGAAMGAIFFFILMGVAISPALLDSTRNATYAKTLSNSLPVELKQIADKATITSLGDPKVLLSEEALDVLRQKFNQSGGGGQVLFEKTVKAIRASFEVALRSVFWISAITMLLALLVISTIPETSMEKAGDEENESEAAALK
jgi:MFS family permease